MWTHRWGQVHQFILPEFDIGAEYGCSAPMICRPRMSREEVMGEYARFKQGDSL